MMVPRSYIGTHRQGGTCQMGISSREAWSVPKPIRNMGVPSGIVHETSPCFRPDVGHEQDCRWLGGGYWWKFRPGY